MLQAALPPLRESASVARLPGVTYGIDVTEVKWAGQQQPRAGVQLGPPQCHRRAERRPPTEPSRTSPRTGVAAHNGVLATLRVAEAAEVLGRIPAQPADAACRTSSPPCRVGPTRTRPRDEGPRQAMWRYLPRGSRCHIAWLAAPVQASRCTAPRASAARHWAARCGRAALDGGHGTGRRGAADLVSPKRPASQAPVEVEVAGGAAVVNLRGGRVPLPCSEWRIVHSGV